MIYDQTSKGCIPSSGFGTRFLHHDNAKELLPIVDKPLIQYAAEEAITAIDTHFLLRGAIARY